jgi:hypothetical protein
MVPRPRVAAATTIFVCLLRIGTAGAAETPHRIAAAPARADITIDGHLNEAAWTAPPFTAFVQRDPHEGAPPSETTELRVVYAEHALYVAIRLDDRQAGSIGRRLSRRDESPDADTVQLYLDPRHDRRSGALFEVSAAGVQRDALIFNDAQLDFSWDAVWDSAVSVDERGWTAELRIPFSQLRFSSDNGGVWGINVARYIRRTNESDWLALVPKRETHLAARMADLTGLASIRPAPPDEIVAHAVARNATGGISGGTLGAMAGTMGADMKHGHGRHSRAGSDGEPDFSQVEGDPAAINLTGFETFLAERRPFFTESAPLFQAFGNPGGGFEAAAPTLFYSRRIGQAPAAAIDVDPVNDPTATPILGAMKLAGEVAGGWKLALLDAIGASSSAPSSLGIAAPRTDVAPVTNFAAGRLFRDSARGGGGVLATAVHRGAFDRSAVASFVPDRALVGGVDGYVFFDRDQQWVAGGQISGSYLSWTPDATAAITAASPLDAIASSSATAARWRSAFSNTRGTPPDDRGGGGPPRHPAKARRPTIRGTGMDRRQRLPVTGRRPTFQATARRRHLPAQAPRTVPATDHRRPSPDRLARRRARSAGQSGVRSGGDRSGHGEHGRISRARSLSRNLGGWSASANVHRNSGAVRVNVDAWAINPGFETNDLGFLPRADIQGVQAQVSWSAFEPAQFTRFRSVDVTKGGRERSPARSRATRSRCRPAPCS